jgi:hypothetical protein
MTGPADQALGKTASFHSGSFGVGDPIRTTDFANGLVSTDRTPSQLDTSSADLPEIPGYRVIREIARGGMGLILGAFDLSLDPDVALKVL